MHIKLKRSKLKETASHIQEARKKVTLNTAYSLIVHLRVELIVGHLGEGIASVATSGQDACVHHQAPLRSPGSASFVPPFQVRSPPSSVFVTSSAL